MSPMPSLDPKTHLFTTKIALQDPKTLQEPKEPQEPQRSTEPSTQLNQRPQNPPKNPPKTPNSKISPQKCHLCPPYTPKFIFLTPKIALQDPKTLKEPKEPQRPTEPPTQLNQRPQKTPKKPPKNPNPKISPQNVPYALPRPQNSPF